MASVRNGVGSLKEVIGGGVANSLLRAVEHDAFMLGGLQWNTDKLPGAIKAELRRLVERCVKAVAPPKPELDAVVQSLVKTAATRITSGEKGNAERVAPCGDGHPAPVAMRPLCA
jgi:hypothetical protein